MDITKPTRNPTHAACDHCSPAPTTVLQEEGKTGFGDQLEVLTQSNKRKQVTKFGQPTNLIITAVGTWQVTNKSVDDTS